MTEPPNPWGPPEDSPEEPPGGWGNPVPGGWGGQQPPAQSPPNYSPGQPGDFSPPPAWLPPPEKRVRGTQIVAGIAAWFAVNFLLFGLVSQGLGGDGAGLLALGVNAAMIIGPAVKGHKGFAIGYALGFVVATVLLIGACFLLLASFGR